jgi:hypothetical protein
MGSHVSGGEDLAGGLHDMMSMQLILRSIDKLRFAFPAARLAMSQRAAPDLLANAASFQLELVVLRNDSLKIGKQRRCKNDPFIAASAEARRLGLHLVVGSQSSSDLDTVRCAKGS